MSETQVREDTFKGAEGIDIYYRSSVVDDERARLVIAHGLGEHSGRYGHVIELLNQMSVSVWALDHRGHGRSGGKRGHIKSFDHYLADLSTLIGMVHKDKAANEKVLLLGHSMGGLMSLYFALNFPELIDGVIASSPGLGMIVEVPGFKKALGGFMSSVWPSMTMGNELDATKISHDAGVVKAYQDDPLVHDRVSARWFTEFMKAMAHANDQAPGMRVMTLMQVAGDDRLVNSAVSRTFFDKLGVSDKKLHFYDGLYHEIYNEIPEDRARVLSDLQAWLEEHI